jgi:hypothetical protein
VRGDAGVTREQDPLTVNSKKISLKLENSRGDEVITVT